MLYRLLIASFLLVVPWSIGFAQEVHQELQETVRAEVLRVLGEETRDIIGTDTDALVQTIQIKVLEGVRAGEVATFEQDLMRVTPGDSIFVNRLVSIDGVEYYQFKDADRLVPLGVLLALFAVLLVLAAGTHGMRALASLALSVCGILFVLVPLLLAGYPPVLVSIGVAGVLLALALCFTHGLHTRTYIAFFGTFGAVVITSAIASVFAAAAHLTGLSSDEAIFLNFSTKGSLDFGALLLGSIIIGILGILDDVAITQASVVHELKRANRGYGIRDLYDRAMRVGRDHVGALVNTLAFAYIGAALPLVLLMAAAGSSAVLSLNQEVVAAELMRIMIGSIGLILAVPLTTVIAAFWYARWPIDDTLEEVHHGSHAH